MSKTGLGIYHHIVWRPLLRQRHDLEWLWDAVCRPCLEALGFNSPVSDNNWPRIWWVLTGLLNQLLIQQRQAAIGSGSADTVIDRVMSSYASSVKALVYGRRNPVHQPGNDQREDAWSWLRCPKHQACPRMEVFPLQRLKWQHVERALLVSPSEAE